MVFMQLVTYIPVLVCVLWLLTCLLLGFRRLKSEGKSFVDSGQFLFNHPWFAIALLAGLGFLIYFLTVVHNLQWDYLRRLSHIWPHSRTGTGHLVNLLAILGLIITGLGSWYTYLQLQWANDRIDDYAKFYDWVEVLLSEIKAKKASRFNFYGSTILPGNISFGLYDKKQLPAFAKELMNIFSRTIPDYAELTEATIVVPDAAAYRSTYGWFRARRMARWKQDQAKWEEQVEKAMNDAIDTQGRLEPTGPQFGPPDPRHKVVALRETDVRFKTIRHAYYVSNGHRVIYAIPLHYVDAPRDQARSETLIPQLVGFTTTSALVVRAFDTHFGELAGAPDGLDQRAILKAMYDRHIVSPSELEKQLKTSGKNLETLGHNELIILAHDHFEGWHATERCASSCKLSQESRVLDVGSGLGGPAVYLASRAGCHVSGYEIQEDRHAFAQRLACNAGLAGNVTLNNCDITEALIPPNFFTHIISFLSILHMTKKVEFLERMGTFLKPGGRIYIEDYYSSDELIERHRERLLKTISCPSLLTLSAFLACTERSGIHVDHLCDTTNVWSRIAADRLCDFKSKEATNKESHGESAVQKAEDFFMDVDRLFSDGIIRGFRLIGTKR
jgi:cyclopropane fatty-acyl-phospholipid synthase-like methyltransferase